MRGLADVVFCLACTLLLCVVLLIILEDHKEEENPDKRPGNFFVDIAWYSTDDVDLWVEGPDGQPVGYSNKQGPYLSLVRDDVGTNPKGLSVRNETVVSQGFQPGWHLINLHGYRIANKSSEVEVEVKVFVRRSDSRNPTLIHHEFVKVKGGQELTVINLQLSKSGALIATNRGFRHVRERSSN